jgi:hypothetical protein
MLHDITEDELPFSKHQIVCVNVIWCSLEDGLPFSRQQIVCVNVTWHCIEDELPFSKHRIVCVNGTWYYRRWVAILKTSNCLFKCYMIL